MYLPDVIAVHLSVLRRQVLTAVWPQPQLRTASRWFWLPDSDTVGGRQLWPSHSRPCLQITQTQHTFHLVSCRSNTGCAHEGGGHWHNRLVEETRQKSTRRNILRLSRGAMRHLMEQSPALVSLPSISTETQGKLLEMFCSFSIWKHVWSPKATS